MTWIELVDRLCALSGVEPFYYDILGTRHETRLESKVLVLGALGSDTSSLRAASLSLDILERECWRDRVAPFVAQRLAPDGFDLDLFLLAEDADRLCSWTITFETGGSANGTFRPQDLNWLGSREIDGNRVEHRRIRIRTQAPVGYHRLQITDADKSNEVTLALAPERCFLPDALATQDRRLWGLLGQLYTLRSGDNWGVGDFGDLTRLCRMAGGSGASTLAINPMHALFPDKPDAASPYSPSSRLFLNPIYVDVARAAGGALDGRPTGPIDILRASSMVDYPKVWAAKRQAFESLFRVFQKHSPDHHLVQDFRRFVERGGQALEQFAAFSALEEIYGGGGSIPWQRWPAAYQVPQGEAYQRFKLARADRVTFHEYVQYLADVQLEGAAHEARVSGMEIGITRDLAVGVSPDGSDAWASRQNFVTDLRCGAPPDDFNPQGQEWGILPLNPLRLRRDSQFFATMLRANMRHAGGLRIDHIIGLQRQFLVPPGGPGCYVRFPIDELLKILAIESHRHSCLVIGEDLGTVAAGFRDRMQEENILGCALLYFERSDGGAFKTPGNYRKKAAASIATHDLPTFRGYWEGRDIAVRLELGISTPSEADTANGQRHQDRARLAEALATVNTPDLSADEIPMSHTLLDAAHAFLASSSAQLFLAQIDDLTDEIDQVNVPGTTSEYPNWRRKLAISIDDPAFEIAIKNLAKLCSEKGRGRRA